MENIFKGAKFGDKFLTRCGEIAIYHIYSAIDDRHFLINSKHSKELSYRSDGTCSLDTKGAFNHDIVSRYQESIGEGKLEELADKYMRETDRSIILTGITPYSVGLEKGFKAGYRKAKEV